MNDDQGASSLADLLYLRGLTAAVTGGAAGIGQAICMRLAELGANLAIGDLAADEASKLAATVGARFGVTAVGCVLDVRQGASIAAFADAAFALSSRLDIWVNNAGVFPIGNIADMTELAWDAVMDVNLRGTFLGVREAAARMRRSPGTTRSRVIVNIASMTGLHGREGRSHYSASKHGVLGLTKSAARELGPEGIRVLAVAPTAVRTPGLEKQAHGTEGAEAARMEAALVARLPLGRVCTPDEVARAVVFCAGELAAMMTGSTLLVDAGYLAG